MDKKLSAQISGYINHSTDRNNELRGGDGYCEPVCEDMLEIGGEEGGVLPLLLVGRVHGQQLHLHVSPRMTHQEHEERPRVHLYAKRSRENKDGVHTCTNCTCNTTSAA